MTDPKYDTTYEGGTVFLPECLTEEASIRNVSFNKCNLIGPAVVIIDSCLFVGGFNLRVPREAKIEAIIWPAHEPRLVGVIGISNSRFVECTWEGIGVIAEGEQDRQDLIGRVTIARYEVEFDEDR